MRKSAGLGLTIVFALCISAQPAAADVWNKAWTAAGIARIMVNADDGNIRVQTGDYKEISAKVETVGWRLADDEVRVIANQSGNQFDLVVKVPSRHISFAFQRSIVIGLTVPRSVELDLHTGDGNITTEPIDGSLRADTGDGNITVGAAKGTLRLHTGDGNIIADGLEGSLVSETGDGNIRIEGRFDALEVHTGDGNIEVSARPGSRVASEWKVDTGDGNIQLDLPDGIAADLDAHTGDGHVTLDFPVTVTGKIEKASLRGQLGGGGPRLWVRTGDGNIRMSKSR